MGLLRRIMWPRTGEDVEVYKNGVLIAAGHVTYADEKTVSIMGARLAISKLDCNELLEGIDNRTIVVKKIKQ